MAAAALAFLAVHVRFSANVALALATLSTASSASAATTHRRTWRDRRHSLSSLRVFCESFTFVYSFIAHYIFFQYFIYRNGYYL